MWGCMKVAVIGASGYVGAELVNLICRHDKLILKHLVVSEGSSSEGLLFSQLHPRYSGICDLPLTAYSENWLKTHGSQLDAVFFATPHEFSAQWAHAFIEFGVKVFDLSGGFRLKNSSDYPQYYGFEHKQLSTLQSAVYGLAEWQANEVENAQLIAVPGCYPTASLLALKPVTEHKLQRENSLIVVNGISGVSGAGRKATLATSFNEVSLTPYNILHHRHQPEISQEADSQVIFNPHLAPYKRGLMATVTLQLKAHVGASQVKEIFDAAYVNKPLIRLTGSWPKIDNVAFTPFADLHYEFDQDKQVLVVCCAIDNLLKGAASQAIQCANISLGLNSDYALTGIFTAEVDNG